MKHSLLSTILLSSGILLLTQQTYAQALDTPPLPADTPCEANKERGDVNCDGNTDRDDFDEWRAEFVAFNSLLGQTPSIETNDRDGSGNVWDANFNDDAVIDLEDFEIWRRNVSDAEFSEWASRIVYMDENGIASLYSGLYVDTTTTSQDTTGIHLFGGDGTDAQDDHYYFDIYTDTPYDGALRLMSKVNGEPTELPRLMVEKGSDGESILRLSNYNTETGNHKNTLSFHDFDSNEDIADITSDISADGTKNLGIRAGDGRYGIVVTEDARVGINVIPDPTVGFDVTRINEPSIARSHVWMTPEDPENRDAYAAFDLKTHENAGNTLFRFRMQGSYNWVIGGDRSDHTFKIGGTSGGPTFDNINSTITLTRDNEVGINNDTPNSALDVLSKNAGAVFTAKALFDTVPGDPQHSISRILVDGENTAATNIVDTQLSFAEAGTTRWTLGHDASSNNFAISNGYGAFGEGNDILFTIRPDQNDNPRFGLGVDQPNYALQVNTELWQI